MSFILRTLLTCELSIHISETQILNKSITLMKTSADSLKKSADALNDASLWEKKKIKKKDEKTGEETEVEDYDLSLIHI